LDEVASLFDITGQQIGLAHQRGLRHDEEGHVLIVWVICSVGRSVAFDHDVLPGGLPFILISTSEIGLALQ
jgi:hypothetical protein